MILTDQEISLVGQKYEIQQDAVLVIAHIRKRKDRLTLVDNEYMKSRYALPYFVPLSDVPRGTIVEIRSIEEDTFTSGTCGTGLKVEAKILGRDTLSNIYLNANYCKRYGETWINTGWSTRPFKFKEKFLKLVK